MEKARKILRDIYGYDDFRLHQADIIGSLIAGKDVLALMPTGGGKSLCYQIPALVREGAGIVVSPLIALMQDQVDALNQIGVRAAYLNSTQDWQELRATEQALVQGQYDIVYVAPERLLSDAMLSLLDKTHIALFAIDEAHCVSQWGHDFRREYQQLSLLQQRYASVPRIALTATADQRTRKEIVEQLGLQRAAIFINSFDRPNIRYTINDSQNPKDRLWQFLQREHPEDAGIIYCLSRKKVESITQWLKTKGRVALPYHAGLSDVIRKENQARFLREDGIIVVATIAFGMGIDKPDVRFVAHLNLPKSIEAYYQETGRAGRDGEPANAWMAYGLQDLVTQRHWVETSAGSEQHKRLSHQRLNALLGMCEMSGCRRQALLAYFNEELAEACGFCDNCETPPQTWDGSISAQKVLSSVYRSGERFGVNYIIDILLGKEDERIQRNRHDKLSTFGIGQDLSQAEWRSTIRQLVAQGYIHVDMESHGSLKLTDKCRPLLRGEETLLLRKIRKPEKTKQKKTSRIAASENTTPNSYDEGLYQALRSLRMRLAKDQGVPAYIIFHDKTLQQMAGVRPGTLHEMGVISGVGERKLALYGENFLEEIRSFAPVLTTSQQGSP